MNKGILIPVVAMITVVAILSGCHGAETPNDEKSFQALLEECSKESTSKACEELAGRIESQISTIVTGTSHEDPATRQTCYILLLFYFPDQLTGETLAERLSNEKDDSVRVSIIDLALERGHSEIVPVLFKEWESTDVRPFLRTAAKGILNLGTPDEIKKLAASINNYSGEARQRRERYLQQAREEELKPGFKRLGG